jgi:LysM repeat protein
MLAGTERLKVNLVQGENRIQTIVRGTIEVPYAKPDVDKVLSEEATAKVRDVSILPDKVVVEGTLVLQLMYVAFKPDQSVHSMHGELDFTTFADVEGARPGSDYVVEFTVEDVKLTPSKKDPRKFDVAAVLMLFVKITKVDELEILTSVPPGNTALETQDITVEHMIGDMTTKQVIVSDQFDVPEEKPDAEKILNAKAEVEITDKKVLAGKVIVDGEVKLQILYAAMTPKQSVHDLQHTIKFSEFVEIPDAQDGMNVHVRAVVEKVDVESLLDPGIAADVIIKLIVFVSETRIIQDVPTRLEDETCFEKRKLKVDRQIGYGETQVVLRETKAVPHEKPDIMKVLESRVDHTQVTETSILSEKVIVRGYIDVQVIYVSTKPNQAVHALHHRLNYRNFVVVPGAAKGMEVHVKAEPEFVRVEQVGVDLHTEVVLKVRATVTDMYQMTVYVPSEVVEPTTAPCEPVYYTVKKGDTLYKIGKAYGVSVADILAANPQITDPDVLEVGQVIEIPCPAKG